MSVDRFFVTGIEGFVTGRMNRHSAESPILVEEYIIGYNC